MTERTFPKALTTLLRTGIKPEDQKYFILPYEGYLTDNRFGELAEKFAKAIAPFYMNKHGVTFENVREQVTKRLKSEWYTGREKNLRLSKKENGNWLLQGENFFMSNYPDGHFIIVE